MTATAAPDIPAAITWHHGPGEGSDPRSAGLVPVSMIVVDQRWQRAVKRARIDKLASKWEWNLAEAVTVKMRSDGRLYAVEGQNRVLSLREIDPEAKIWCILVPGITTPAEEAAIGNGIAEGRLQHSTYSRWKLKLSAGEPHEVAAEHAMTELNLIIAEGASRHGISAVGAVSKIVHGSARLPRTPEEGAWLLQQTLRLLRDNVTDAQGHEGRKFDAALLQSVAEILSVWPGVDEERLAAKLTARNSLQWLSFRSGKPPAWRGVFTAMVDDYNANLRARRLTLS